MKRNLTDRERDQLIDDVAFLYNEAASWVGNKAPEDMDDFEQACDSARDRLYALIGAENITTNPLNEIGMLARRIANLTTQVQMGNAV
jgi:hypothetical protein